MLSEMLSSIIIVVGAIWIAGIPFVVREIRKDQDVKLGDIFISCILGGAGTMILFIETSDFLDKYLFYPLQNIHLPQKIRKLSLNPTIFKKTGGAKQCK